MLKNFGCYSLITGGKSHRIAFIGFDDDVTICQSIFDFAAECIYENVKRLQKSFRNQGLSVNNLENNYAIGFVHGLNQRYEEQTKTDESYALILQKDQEVVDHVNSLNLKGSFDTSIHPDKITHRFC